MDGKMRTQHCSTANIAEPNKHCLLTSSKRPNSNTSVASTQVISKRQIFSPPLKFVCAQKSFCFKQNLSVDKHANISPAVTSSEQVFYWFLRLFHVRAYFLEFWKQKYGRGCVRVRVWVSEWQREREREREREKVGEWGRESMRWCVSGWA